MTVASSLIAQEVPDTVKPGVSQRQFEKIPEPKSSPQITLPRLQEQLGLEEAEKISFTLNSMDITGSTVFSASGLKTFYAQYLGQKINLKTVFNIAAALKRAYGERGYALSTAYVPAQEIDEKGNVKIIVVEGYISSVEFTGDTQFLSPRNKRRLEELKGQRPLTMAFLEQQLLLVNESPGVTVSSSIDHMNDGPGAVLLKVKVNGQKYDLNAGINNRGSKAQGRERYDIGGAVRHLADSDDRLSASIRRTFDANELNYYSFAYTRLIHDTGTLMDLGISYSIGEPGVDILELLDYETKNMVYRIGFSQPLVRSRKLNTTTFTSFEINNSKSDILGVYNSEQDVRTLRIGFEFDMVDRFKGQTLGRMALSRGLDIFGATGNNETISSRIDADYTFTTLRSDLYRLQALDHGFSYFAQVSGQYAFDPLPYSEQYGFGGGFLGRAYDSSEISGDNCLMAGIELRYQVPEKPARVDSLEPFVFASAGKSWIKGGSSDSGTDAGLGVKLRLFKRHDVSIEWAKPLDHVVALEGNKNGRFFMGWNYRF